MQLCLFGVHLNFVLILGLVSNTYITALPVTGSSKKVDTVPTSDLIHGSNEWSAEITFPAQSSEFLSPSLTSSFKTDIEQAIKLNVLPGNTVNAHYALFESIPSFNRNGKIPFDITWKRQKAIFMSQGDITKVKSDSDPQHFQIQVNLHPPNEAPGGPSILVNSQRPYVGVIGPPKPI
ncbi:hypothetical protein F5890DRAFT_671520 [Lentinula detonsa]|uniref:Uncharacterized protein n=1 Tax=Lentinula detonsa TaxID=2804962 RepID=A0AA38PSS0_9AGAR|nr:hypothetical protein F5890DRAFT_671520 [Lentinula detonsa]